MAGLRQMHPDVRFGGVGGPLMQAQGLTSLFPMEELSVMGLAEVLPKYFPLKRRIAQAAKAAVAAKPCALITIDSPDFCLRVAKLVKVANPAPSPICARSIMSPPRFGRGGRGGRPRWRGRLTMCWPCCPLSRPI